MSEVATSVELALVRAAADGIVAAGDGGEYATMARATLVALDWVEGRRERAPATGRLRGLDEISREITDAEDLERAARSPGNRDEFYRLTATWGALSWYRNPQLGGQLPIYVPGLSEPVPPRRYA